eukprot:3537665-Pyramimonas_sp.AAC.1
MEIQQMGGHMGGHMGAGGGGDSSGLGGINPAMMHTLAQVGIPLLFGRDGGTTSACWDVLQDDTCYGFWGIWGEALWQGTILCIKIFA